MASGLAVIVPVASVIEPDCERGLQDLEKRGHTVRRVPCHVAIDLGRSQVASDLLREGFDELMWIDADIGFHADAVQKLRDHGKPFTCGVYPKRGPAELAARVKPGTKELVFGPMGGLFEMLYVGFGFCHVRREVFDAIVAHESLPLCGENTPRPFHPYFLPMVIPHEGTHWYLAEDYAFCERARRAGHPVIADTSIRLFHIGRYGYTWEEALGPRQRYDNVKMILERKP